MSSHPNAALLIVGAEVLSGKVEDENGPYLMRRLRALGVEVVEVRVIGDEENLIAAAVRELSGRATWLVTTGGIGPTHDDVTLAGVAKAFSRQITTHPQLLQALRDRFGDAVGTARLKMAEVPEGAQIHQPPGCVPVVQLHNVFVLPGVPTLMRAVFAQLESGFSGPPFFGGGLLLGVGESEVAELLTAVQGAHPEVAIGSYPRFDAAAYRVKITVDGRSAAAVDACLVALRQTLPPASIVGEL